MFFISSISVINGEISCSRCVGYKKTFEEADEVVKNNRCDLNETIYDYAVIEELEDGIYPHALNEWFYKFNYETQEYEMVEKPKEFEYHCNYAIG